MGDRIRRTRLVRGIAQNELAEAAGVRPHTMYRYEVGELGPPGPERLQRIADALGVPLRWLIKGGSNPPGLSFDDGPAPRRVATDQRLGHEQQLQLLDEIDAPPDLRAAWTFHMQGTGAHQKITRVYVSQFLDIAGRELADGASIEDAASAAGQYAFNAALDAHLASHKKPTKR